MLLPSGKASAFRRFACPLLTAAAASLFFLASAAAPGHAAVTLITARNIAGTRGNGPALTTATYRFRQDVVRNGSQLRFNYVNTGTDPITIKATVEADGAYRPILFGGQPSITLAAGQRIASDALAGFTAVAGSSFYVRSNVSVESGKRWMNTGVMDDTRGDRVSYGTDTTNGGATVAHWNGGFGPVSITAHSNVAGQPTIALVGDSLSEAATGWTKQGYTARALGDLVTLNLSQTGQTSGYHLEANTKALYHQDLAYCDSALVLLGTNNLRSGSASALANMKSGLINVVNYLKAQGLTVYLATLPPMVDGGGDYTTEAGQKFNATYLPGALPGGNRDLYNDWIRSNFFQLGAADYVDFDALFESTVEAGKWRTDRGAMTVDGVHFSAAGAQLAADALAAKRATATMGGWFPVIVPEAGTLPLLMLGAGGLAALTPTITRRHRNRRCSGK